jgi:hypothetical protein
MTPATDRQMRYLRDLVEATGAELGPYLIKRGISEQKGWREPYLAATRPSKEQASRLIAELAPARSYSDPRRGGRRSRYSGRRTYFERCTHEDYPCCGCER